MICIQCKSEISQTAKFCPKCGSSITIPDGINKILIKEKQQVKPNRELEKLCFNLSIPHIQGMRAIFCGEPGTRKEGSIEKIAKLLFESGKINEENPIRLDFGAMKDFDPKKLYVIGDISTAIQNLFNMEDFSDEATSNQLKYRVLLERLISLPRNLFIIIDVVPTEKKGFLTLNPKLPFIFENIVDFQELTSLEVFERFKEGLIQEQRAKADEKFKEDFIEYLDANKKYFPFKNQELADYLSDYSSKYESLQLPPSKHQEQTIEEAFKNIVGMDYLKNQARELRCYLSVRTDLEKMGKKMPAHNLNMMFLGNPGVGKTTVARIIGKLLFNLGYIKEDKFVEVTSKDLVGVGNQTGIKTNRAIMNAMGGVLFIDEAYSLSESCGPAGAEAIATLVKAMEDYKGDLVCMFAGYKYEMKGFIEANSGIASRIAYVFRFDDYTQQELMDIFDLKVKNMGLKVTKEAREEVWDRISSGLAVANFGNGRYIDNLIQKTLTKHAVMVKENGGNIEEIGKKSIPELSQIIMSE